MPSIGKNGRVVIAAVLGAVFFAGCAGFSKLKIPAVEDVLRAGPLANIVVYKGNVPLGESGASADGTNISIGGTVYFSAQGRDGNNKFIPVVPKWTASQPDILEITPSVGQIVAVKGLREGTAEIVAEMAGVRHTVQYVFIK
jgi:hypothetical protein